MSFVVRHYAQDDAPALRAIFHRAVRDGAARYYSEKERSAWSPSAEIPPGWADRLGGQCVRVAEAVGAPIGFMTLTDTGYIDLAFVLPEWMGRGVADALLADIMRQAGLRGLPRLTTEASFLARSFFLRHGWQVDAEQRVERFGVELTNFRMSLAL